MHFVIIEIKVAHRNSSFYFLLGLYLLLGLGPTVLRLFSFFFVYLFIIVYSGLIQLFTAHC